LRSAETEHNQVVEQLWNKPIRTNVARLKYGEEPKNKGALVTIAVTTATEPRNYLELLYRRRIANLMNEVRKAFPEDYKLFTKIRSYYLKIQASSVTTYTRLTRLRTACKLARKLFGKPLSELEKEEWETLAIQMYSMYRTKDAIVSAIHPLRLAMKYRGFDEKELKEVFPYPNSMKAKAESENPPPYVPGELLDKVIFAIGNDMYRAFFALMRITGARVEEVALLKRRNIIEEGDTVYVKFDVTKTGVSREVPIVWPGFEQHLKIFLSWYKHQHPFVDNPDAWLFPKPSNPNEPVPRNYAYLALKRAAVKLAKTDPEIRKYLKLIHPHQMRHTRAYELVFQNWNIRWIMAYMGWRKVEMVLRYTRAFEIKQIHKMIVGRKENASTKICPRCNAIIPRDAKFCPYCGLRLEMYDLEQNIKRRKRKQKILELLLELVEELGVDHLKELLLSKRTMLKE